MERKILKRKLLYLMTTQLLVLAILSSIYAETFTVIQGGVTQYTLPLTKAGTGTGTVISNPSGTSFNAGTVVTLTATPYANSTFSGWSGGYTGTSPTCTVTLNANTNVIATFTLKTYAITGTSGANGFISPAGQVSVAHGSTQGFTITPNSGYQVADVVVDGTSVGKPNSYTFSNITGNHTLVASFTLSSQVPSPAGIIRLKFDEGTGSVALDSSGNGNHGTIYGTTYTTSSAVGTYALYFDGINDYVGAKGSGSFEALKSSNLSISLWVKHAKNTSSAYGGILKGPFGDGYNTGLRMLDYANKPLLQINFGESSPGRIPGNLFSTNKWCHLVFTYDHQNIKLYQDGQLVQAVPETREINWGTYSLDLTIGLAQWYFKGAIDNVAVYNYALTLPEIQELEKGSLWKD